jgi:acyl carrier protein
MNVEDIVKDVEKIVRIILNNDSIKLSNQTNFTDVPGWDSLSNIRIVLAIEDKYRIKYSAEEIRTINVVGALCGIIQERVK